MDERVQKYLNDTDAILATSRKQITQLKIAYRLTTNELEKISFEDDREKYVKMCEALSLSTSLFHNERYNYNALLRSQRRIRNISRDGKSTPEIGRLYDNVHATVPKIEPMKLHLGRIKIDVRRKRKHYRKNRKLRHFFLGIFFYRIFENFFYFKNFNLHSLEVKNRIIFLFAFFLFAFSPWSKNRIRFILNFLILSFFFYYSYILSTLTKNYFYFGGNIFDYYKVYVH